MDRPFLDFGPEREALDESRTARALALAIAARHGLGVGELLEGARATGAVSAARRELYRALTAAPFSWSPGAIGRFVLRDRTTILHALGKRPGR